MVSRLTSRLSAPARTRRQTSAQPAPAAQRRPVRLTFTMTSDERWQPYDPRWLVELARVQLPEETWLPDALAACTRFRRRSDAYIYFVDNRRPNEPDHRGNMTLALNSNRQMKGGSCSTYSKADVLAESNSSTRSDEQLERPGMTTLKNVAAASAGRSAGLR
jgi:hypothetical protein